MAMASKKSLGSPDRRRKKPPRPAGRAPLSPEALFSDLSDVKESPAAPPPPLLSDEKPTEIYEGPKGALGRLEIEAGRHSGETVLLGSGSCVIGRSSKCSMVLRRSAGVSRRHAKVFFEGGVFYVEDLESRNGTRLNGRSVIGKVPLVDGDLIAISDERIRYHGPSAERAQAHDEHDQETALFDPPKKEHPRPITPPPLPDQALATPRTPATRPAPVELDEGVDVSFGDEPAIPLEAPKGPSRPAMRPAPGPAAPPRRPPTPPPLEPIEPAPARAEPPPLEPVLAPSTSSYPLPPLGVPDPSAPMATPPALPPDSSPYVHQPKPKRSSGLFVVGGFLGLLLALGLVVAWDLTMNQGLLTDEVIARAEALAGVAGETSEADEVEAGGEGAETTAPKTVAEAETPNGEAAAGEPPKEELAKVEPPKEEVAKVEPPEREPVEEPKPSFTVRASAAGVVESVRVKVGDVVKANQVVVVLGTSNPRLARKLKALRREEESFAKFAAQGNERARRDLEEVRRELRSLEAQLRGVSVRAAASGRVTAVLVKRGQAVKSGAVVAKVRPE